MVLLQHGVGPRAGLRPLYEQLLTLGLGLGDDVKACPCKTMGPVRQTGPCALRRFGTRHNPAEEQACAVPPLLIPSRSIPGPSA